MISDADIATLAELGVVASMQPAFDAAWGKPGELYEQRLGPSRAHAMNRLGTLERSGVRLAFGTDSPVTPLAGWATVRAAVQHWQPSERLSGRLRFRCCNQRRALGSFRRQRGHDTGRGVGQPCGLGRPLTTVWKGPRRCLGWTMARSRPARRRSPLGSSSIDRRGLRLGRLGPCPGPSRP